MKCGRCHCRTLNVSLCVYSTVVPQTDEVRLFSYEDDFGDLDEIPPMPSGDQLVSHGGTSTMQTQTSQVCIYVSV